MTVTGLDSYQGESFVIAEAPSTSVQKIEAVRSYE
jgi:hypothetical protein